MPGWKSRPSPWISPPPLLGFGGWRRAIEPTGDLSRIASQDTGASVAFGLRAPRWERVQGCDSDSSCASIRLCSSIGV